MMIHRLSDRFKIDFGYLKVIIAPLSYQVKSEINSLMELYRKEHDQDAGHLGIKLAMKHSIKGFEGVIDSNGNKYELEFEEYRNCLTDECIDEILSCSQLDIPTKIVAFNLLDGIPNDNEIINPETMKISEGITIKKIKGYHR